MGLGRGGPSRPRPGGAGFDPSGVKIRQIFWVRRCHANARADRMIFGLGYPAGAKLGQTFLGRWYCANAWVVRLPVFGALPRWEGGKGLVLQGVS